ncbi:alkaline phosphatase [Capnocytophaga canimorsus]|uniref:Alkaline phosphatase n=1 Tax=Capnocytophaga canimorsus TaxID=28188 RepID=A0A250G1Q6_9FLAO|nr:alkaline phosphatase [Capnocytophaga canimorsus]ATA91274.1 alkaline phosphatase [Capnocytophaga canimorsus]AWL78122.1 alkaline phosphatase [Capnocytophaga canimorsus]AYW36758.1 alkaline phosphatase [Capnocytophaga canimorsus]MDT9499439.1 alkaline phosphatase [Capnocytophaga canimorsus]GIM55683.1 alkaline phosphatase [Capnocytophaga canimorsus]
MKRRQFFKKSALAGMGSLFVPTFAKAEIVEEFGGKTPKNIIYMVSDGMSSGTLTMADLYSRRILGKPSNWISLYEQSLATKAYMDMQSLSSVVTDSAAASSSWGGGHRVPNGRLNVGPNGEMYTPIWQKFKKAGKKVGCVTTVPITHATPAGFCVNSKARNAQEDIAEQYLQLRFDVMMGGGDKYFSSQKRKDKKDMYQQFVRGGFTVVKNKTDMKKAPKNKPLLGVFDEEGLPYSLDYTSEKDLQQCPTLAEMTAKAIEQMQDHSKGFVLQVEGGKVDWAAHGNDIGALLFDQLAFDQAVGVALEFAQKDKNTLVVVTTDHGNANPGLIYGQHCNTNFDNLQHFRHSNDWVLQNIDPNSSAKFIKEIVAEHFGGLQLTQAQSEEIQSYYVNHGREDGVYNYKHLPYRLLAEIQKSHTSVGWISMDHSSDYVELAMYGPGSENLKPFMKNYEMHNFLLQVANVGMLA